MANNPNQPLPQGAKNFQDTKAIDYVSKSLVDLDEKLKRLTSSMSKDAQHSIVKFKTSLDDAEKSSRNVTQEYIKAQLSMKNFNNSLDNATKGLSQVYRESGAKGVGQSIGSSLTGGSAIGSAVGGAAGMGVAALGQELAAPFKAMFSDAANNLRKSFEEGIRSSFSGTQGALDLTKRREQALGGLAQELGPAMGLLSPGQFKEISQPALYEAGLMAKGDQVFREAVYGSGGILGIGQQSKDLARGVASDASFGAVQSPQDQALMNSAKMLEDSAKAQKESYYK